MKKLEHYKHPECDFQLKQVGDEPVFYVQGSYYLQDIDCSSPKLDKEFKEHTLEDNARWIVPENVEYCNPNPLTIMLKQYTGDEFSKYVKVQCIINVPKYGEFLLSNYKIMINKNLPQNWKKS